MGEFAQMWPHALNMPAAWAVWAIFAAARFRLVEIAVPPGAATLEKLGFAVDVSVNPRMNYTSEGGPSFEDMDTAPFWFGAACVLVGLGVLLIFGRRYLSAINARH